MSAAAGPSSSSAPSVDPQTSALLASLHSSAEKSDANPKPLIKSTLHRVPRQSAPGAPQAAHSASSSDDVYEVTSWKTVEFAYRKAAEVGIGKDLPTLARGLFTVKDGAQHATQEASSEASGRQGDRIVVRGYDKFFNVGEISWTKPASIERYSAPPYLLTFKENGCIIFISALSPTQLIVTSKHSLDSQQARQLQEQQNGHKQQADTVAAAEEADEIGGEQGGSSSSTKTSHAAKGEEWLERHLARVGRSKHELAEQLWSRGETAVAELCDDSFEEHVLAYPPEKSGLHLHGLNSNTVAFQTRPMEDVCAFATSWGFIPTRYISLDSMDEVKQFTDRVGTTGEWQGEAIEGFVVRTSMPKDTPQGQVEGAASPPYIPGQAWFYKVKFDEPYLMYRDWRELTKKMLTDKKKWENATHASTSSGQAGELSQLATKTEAVKLQDSSNESSEKKSKSQLKREQKARRNDESQRQAAARGAAPLPAPPKARSNRPETRLFIQWCHDRIYGSEDGKVKPNPAIFEGINVGKGIIRLRDMFLAYLKTEEGIKKIAGLGGPRGAVAAKLEGQGILTGTTSQSEQPAAEDDRSTRPYTHLLIVPIAIPGCGKTSLFLSLSHLYPQVVGHTQSDDVKSKKTAPTFLKNICNELSKHRVVLADRNNHLLKHRDEIVEAIKEWENRGGLTEEQHRAQKKANAGKSSKQAGVQNAQDSGSLEEGKASEKPRVKIVAMAWSLDMLPLNTLHRLMSDRILARGDNHQSLIADTKSATGSRSHETILWRFLQSLETLNSAEGKGEGDKGMGDANFDETITLQVESSQEEQLTKVCQELRRAAVAGIEKDLKQPSDEQVRAALAAAAGYRVSVKKVEEPAAVNVKKGQDTARAGPRYYGIAVELDLRSVMGKFLKLAAQRTSTEVLQRARDMFAFLRDSDRVVLRPHITLVHSSALRALSPEEEAQLDDSKRAERSTAKSKWDRYSALSRLNEPVDFDITLGHLVFDELVMAFSISNVHPTQPASKHLASEEFWKLQGGKGGAGEGDWRPHVTVGTRDESVRPFEANRVMREAEDDQSRRGELGLIEAGETQITLRGRLMGMS
ncbi:hypothetical protein BCV69DRAFT_314465 [Microstroma glucosiphilum]|uniref:tRNA ligase phosphodiesterase domain-containing protein n=1 Tax=Pseudomicrostroma glucosiphilum TaxID=1684307 RepID=A0A316U272_9BASI|nr:hypothetical protein BCV69DRAFT_314465 [Pseudomicrostroma glucosiphilum]PWN18581.1 hypothetical protein BCV69DRAFT_314465 [Pseudomicrostroma glucosiphilum]